MTKGTAQTAGGAVAVALLGGTLYVAGVLDVGDTITLDGYEGVVVALYNIDSDPEFDCVDLQNTATGEIVRLAVEMDVGDEEIPADVFAASDFVIVPDDWVVKPDNPCAVPNFSNP